MKLADQEFGLLFKRKSGFGVFHEQHRPGKEKPATFEHVFRQRLGGCAAKKLPNGEAGASSISENVRLFSLY